MQEQRGYLHTRKDTSRAASDARGSGWSSTADGEDEGKETRGERIAELRREVGTKTRGNITQHAGKKERQSAHVCVSYVAVLGNDARLESWPDLG